MLRIKHIIAALLFAGTWMAQAQQTPAPAQEGSVLITGATAHVGNGQVIENSAVGFENGKITYIGPASGAEAAAFDEVINAGGKHVYPGFIALNSTLGLVEIDAVRASNDIEEIGNIIPHIRALIAYNAESKVVESMRPNGVLTAQITPREGRISGTSSVVQLDAWNWEDAAIKTDDAIHMNWPESFVRKRWWMGEGRGFKPNDQYTEQLDEVASFFREAKAYAKGQQEPRNLALEAIQGIFDGSKKLFVNVNGQKEIADMVSFMEEHGVESPVIVGGHQADAMAELLAEKNIPVIVSRPHRLPSTDDTQIKKPFMLASALISKGVLTGIDVSGQMERMNTRNLPFYAGSVAAYGVDKEKAVQMITGDAAKILGIEDFTGTLETGKDATLFIAEGDALDMRTNQLSKAYIQGRDISLETHQTELWKRYSGKYAEE
ncbi:amidohydrolase family protein [Robertkochia flava]|uniref:amidohydrolase family protein n=1 Tax=Robertkochia flava TaxID=3447986 RepID=UPI001CCEBBA6|nr:amidohydrolase family protein [Robertkochia marina]